MEHRDQIFELINRFPELSYNEINNSIEGELFISKDDSYHILMDLNPYPKFFPRVFELDERIPKKVNRHIYSDTGSCCFTTQAKSQIFLKTKITSLYLFVKEVAIPYFQNNSYYEINGKYKTLEHSHNGMGVIEGYRDILQTSNDRNIAFLMYQRIKGTKLRLHDLCYCGSDQTLKKCESGKHFICYKEFRKIDLEQLISDMEPFMKLLKI